MKLSIAQIDTRAGDFARTAERVVSISEAAAAQGADLLLLPLAALTGPLPVQYGDREGYLVDLSEALSDLSARLACPCLAPIVCDLDGDPLPEAMLLRDGDVVPLRMSSYLAGLAGMGAREDDESDDGPLTLEVGGVELAVAFTYDDLDDLLDERPEVDAVVYFAGFGYALDDASSVLAADLTEGRYVADARELDAWFVGVGSVGGYGTQVYTGSSFVLAPWGQLAACAPSFEEAVVTAEVDPAAEGPLARPLPPEVFNKPLHLWEALTLGLRDYLGKLDLGEVALALDGGAGTLLLATLASDALGPTHVHAVLAEGVTEEGAAASRELARNLHLDLREGADAPAAEAIAHAPAPAPAAVATSRAQVPFGRDEALLHDLTAVRVSALAREVAGIALTAEDKTALALEAAPGTCTPSQLMPLGDVYRSDVLELARLRNTISPVIPAAAMRDFRVPDVEGLASAAPTDAERLALCDTVLASLVEWEQPLTDVVAQRGEPVVVRAIARRLRDREPFRLGRTLCLMVSSRTLYDARSPLGLAWHDRVRGEGERMSERQLMDYLQELTARSLDLAGGGEGPQGGAQGEDAREDEDAGPRDVRDVLGLLRDLARGDLGDRLGRDGEDGLGGGQQGMGPTGPLSWGGPFSEN